MEDRTVPNRNVIADKTRNFFVHVYHCTVLNVGATPDSDRFQISTEHAVKPNARFLPNRYIANNHRPWSDENRGMHIWHHALVLYQHFSFFPARETSKQNTSPAKTQ